MQSASLFSFNLNLYTMKNLLVFTAWVLGSTLTAVIPAAILAVLTPATYQDIMTCSAYVAITFIFGTCLVGVCVAQEVHEYLEK